MSARCALLRLPRANLIAGEPGGGAKTNRTLRRLTFSPLRRDHAARRLSVFLSASDTQRSLRTHTTRDEDTVSNFLQVVAAEVQAEVIERELLFRGSPVLAIPRFDVNEAGDGAAADGSHLLLAREHAEEERVDALLAELAALRDEGVLVVAESGQRREPKGHLESILHVDLRGALTPEEAERRAAVVLRYFQDHVDVGLAALRARVEDVRQHGEHADALARALLLDVGVRRGLRERRRRTVLLRQLQGVLYNARCGARAVVGNRCLLLARPGQEDLDGRVPVDAVLSRVLVELRRVHGAEDDVVIL
mmetsp:Transcript_18490/g.56517  ORF Transcript_18490/g.56517 Transcript_18490/m.56517 type:complete len:307 (-) Transcript_18490:744-1664(-)